MGGREEKEDGVCGSSTDERVESDGIVDGEEAEDELFDVHFSRK
jgi:hypothetical protein